MSILLDTCVIIDYLRGNPEAIAYIQALPSQPSVSVITITELLTGARNKKEREKIQTIIDASIVLEVSEDISVLAGEWLNKYFKSHGVGLGDGLIAATAQVNNLQVSTRNIKHYPMFPNLTKPYPDSPKAE